MTLQGRAHRRKLNAQAMGRKEHSKLPKQRCWHSSGSCPATTRMGWPEGQTAGQTALLLGQCTITYQLFCEYSFFDNLLIENHLGNSGWDLQAHSSHGRGASKDLAGAS